MRLSLIIVSTLLALSASADPVVPSTAISTCTGNPNPQTGECAAKAAGTSANPIVVTPVVSGGQTPATAQKQDTGNNILNAMSINQANVQSAPGTPASAAVTVQGSASGIPVIMVPVSCAWTWASFVLTATVSRTILAAGSYKAVVVQNVGANPVNRIAAGTSAILATDAGIALDPATSPNVQGGSYVFPLPPSNAVQAISTLGTTVTVGTCS